MKKKNVTFLVWNCRTDFDINFESSKVFNNVIISFVVKSKKKIKKIKNNKISKILPFEFETFKFKFSSTKSFKIKI